MKDLNLKLREAPKGGVYVTGEIEGHDLVMETTGRGAKGQIIKITIKAAHPLLSKKEPALTVSDIIQVLTPKNPMVRGVVRGVVGVNHANNTIIYKQPNSELNLGILQDALAYIVCFIDAYSDIVALGGEVVPLLLTEAEKREFLVPFVKQALRDIAEDTQRRLPSRASQLICPTCLTRFAVHKVRLPEDKAGTETYIGCRMCGQSRAYLVGEMVAILDEAMVEPVDTRIGSVRVSWLAHKQLFDFDRVEVKQASDEAVERFAMQIGNDTDTVRRQRYGLMRCDVSCDLSENSRRILKRTFS